jgi:hypothetical protein
VWSWCAPAPPPAPRHTQVPTIAIDLVEFENNTSVVSKPNQVMAMVGTSGVRVGVGVGWGWGGGGGRSREARMAGLPVNTRGLGPTLEQPNTVVPVVGAMSCASIVDH